MRSINYLVASMIMGTDDRLTYAGCITHKGISFCEPSPDPVRPGQVVQYKVTVSNLTTASQYVTLSYHVPNFTVDGNCPAGTAFSYNVGYVAAGTSQSVNFPFTANLFSGSERFLP
jgi:hypothetical protein